MKTIPRILVFALIASLSFYSCDNDNETTPIVDPTGIPADNLAGASPVIEGESNTRIPNPHFSISEQFSNVVNLEFTGIQNPQTEEWLKLYGTTHAEQNIWVEVDGQAKGILVQNVSDNSARGLQLMCDLVFLVDNSGSMAAESNVVATELTAWAKDLATQGLDIKFGCVGYHHTGVNGGIDMGDVDAMDNFLNNRTNHTSGQTRTQGFAGDNAAALEAAKGPYTNTGNYECGVRALRFANDHYDFRYGANRIYVNLTDEPNQPNGEEYFSVEQIHPDWKWNSNDGTIHTVYSASSNFTHVLYHTEHPWLMSDNTGGSKMLDVDQNYTGVNLSDFPVTGALRNAYRVTFRAPASTRDAATTHNVKITILSKDGAVKAVKEYEAEW